MSTISEIAKIATSLEAEQKSLDKKIETARIRVTWARTGHDERIKDLERELREARMAADVASRDENAEYQTLVARRAALSRGPHWARLCRDLEILDTRGLSALEKNGHKYRALRYDKSYTTLVKELRVNMTAANPKSPAHITITAAGLGDLAVAVGDTDSEALAAGVKIAVDELHRRIKLGH